MYLPGEGEGPESVGDWADFDPTNGRQPGEDYVTLAIGRDYSDVSPMRGVLHGGARHTLHVGVTVQPVGEVVQLPASAAQTQTQSPPSSSSSSPDQESP
ncbi:hypothetical protein D3C72_1522440 [compost metagenome]